MAAGAVLLWMIGCIWMNLHAAFYWNSFWWSLLFCTIHLISQISLFDYFGLFNHTSTPAEIGVFLGVVCTYMGVFMLLLPAQAFLFFRIFFNVGLISFTASFLFWLVEKIYNEQIQSANKAAREALTQTYRFAKALAEVTVAFFNELAASLLPSALLQPHARINEREIMITNKERRELEQALNRARNEGKKVTFSTVIGAVFWESGIPHGKIDAWYTDAKKFAALFILGAGCTFAGVWVRNLPQFGLTPFIVGNLCIMFSTFFLQGPCAQLEMTFTLIYDESRVGSALLMTLSFVLTQLTIFWWDSFVLASIFCILYIGWTAWYSLSYVTFGRYAVKKVLSYYFQKPSDTPERQTPSLRARSNSYYNQ